MAKISEEDARIEAAKRSQAATASLNPYEWEAVKQVQERGNRMFTTFAFTNYDDDNTSDSAADAWHQSPYSSVTVKQEPQDDEVTIPAPSSAYIKPDPRQEEKVQHSRPPKYHIDKLGTRTEAARKERGLFVKEQPKIKFPYVGPLPKPSWNAGFGHKAGPVEKTVGDHVESKKRRQSWLEGKKRNKEKQRKKKSTYNPPLIPGGLPNRALDPGSVFFVDPMTSPGRILRGWTNDALNAAFEHSDNLGQLKGLSSAHKLELRRTREVPDEERVLSFEDREVCLSIVQETSSAAYKAATMGWHLQSKRSEMHDKDMLYLIVRTSDGSHDAFWSDVKTDIIAFISFKIDYDDAPNHNRQVVYIYEVHIAEMFRGQGLGKWLVFTVEAMAQSVSIHKTMLTVFKSNKNAIVAYEKMGYGKDPATPEDRVLKDRVIECDYMIMSKRWHSHTSEVLM